MTSNTPGAQLRQGRPAVSRRSAGAAAGPRSALATARGWIARVPPYPILLSVYPVLLLYSGNLDEVEIADVLPPLAIVVGVTVMTWGVLALVWRSLPRAAIVTAAAIVPCLSFGFVVAAVEPAWPGASVVRSQLVALLTWMAILTLAIAVAHRTVARLPALTQMLNTVAVTLIVLVSLPLAGYAIDTRGQASVPHAGPTGTRGPVRADAPRRDIYHLVFDRYGSEAALRAGFGIENGGFVSWLRDHGFQVLDHARANYERTVPSLSASFSMELHDDLAVEMGKSNPDPRPMYDRLWNNPAAATLQALGYRYLHFGSWYRQLTRSDIADHVELPQFEVSFASTLFANSAIPFASGLLAIVTSSEPEGPLEPWAQGTLAQLERVEAAVGIPGPKLVFAHFLLPHEPYVFLADGTFDPDQASYETQMRFANVRIQRLIEPLLALPPDEQPIIIIQADEGPYPERYERDPNAFDWSTATDTELVTKYGVLSAWYLPRPAGATPLPPDLSLVNTYPEIITRYLGVEVPRSPDRSYVMRQGKPYDLVDVTDRLRRALERIGADDG